MKRIYLWLRELSLSQQLITISFLVIMIFSLFLVSILFPQITFFTENEMFRILHVSQESTAYYLEENPNKLPSSPIGESTGIVQGVYVVGQDEIIGLGGGTFSVEETLQIIEEIESGQVSSTKDYQFIEGNNRNTDKVLYTISPLKDGRYLISKLPSSYEDSFRNAITNNVVSVNILVALILFLFLTIWIATLIHPLNQIKNYIDKLRKDEEATLNVDRHDEIGEVADALRDMEEALNKQNREKQEMIQNISHDLKTPIATIRSYGESIKDGVYPYGTLEKSIDVIVEHADRLDKKVRSLIALNKMDYLLDDCPEGDTLNMAEVIDKVLLALKVIRPEIEFIQDVDRNVHFHGEEEPWRIVVENLVDNALRYAKSKIIIALHEDELYVENDGKSIPQEHMNKLFFPYEKGTDGQFGLGLSIVHKVVSTYGYHVEAENLQNAVRFRIYREVSKKEKKARDKEKRARDKEIKKESKKKKK
ncbi:MAG: HAMP domain-containing histidine kinase [Solobacterium sp.]|nr:HAMP domain-containing histidine kinase [Solobacterium sp.]